MARSSSRYECTECGATFGRWSGRCPNCEEWDSLQETAAEDSASRRRPGGPAATSYLLEEIPPECRGRVRCGIPEFDRVLGGGMLPGGTVLLGGDPGIGKSTILLQALGNLSRRDHRCLYVSCEESLGQIKLRARRLGLSDAPLRVSAATGLDAILGLLADEEPQVAVIDSIQMVVAEGVDSPIGSLRHLKTSASELIRRAKEEGFALFLVGHVTKQGAIAGPKALEHMVDTVLYFESERLHSMRILRAAKNRFGSTNEIGVFQMSAEGLRNVENPSELFLAERDCAESGSVVTATIEGNRALLVEIQALVSPSSYGTPERKATGVDYKRFGMLLSVLERRAGLSLGASDAFANVAGGVRLVEPAVDLPLALAIISSSRDVPCPAEAVALGEVGLSGEVRAVGGVERRLKEATKLGFARAFIPAGNASSIKEQKMELVPVRHLRQAARLLEK